MKAASTDLTLHALGRLPAPDAHEFEAKLAADPALAGELRELEDTLTQVWHAASPLVPAPAGCFEAVRAHLHPVRGRPRLAVGLAVAGWAAAITLGVMLFLKPSSPAVASGVPPAPPLKNATRPPDFKSTPSADAVPPDTAPMQTTLRRLQHELAIARQTGGGPKIRSLRPPGSRAATSPADQARALNDLLTSALAEHLARQSEVPSSLTVETGWLESLFAALPDDALIRHRAFPVDNFGDFGLLRAENGEFFDPRAHMLWSPAQDGGGYLGRVVATDFAPVGFEPAPPEAPAEKPVETPQAEPSGYLVQTGGDATVIIGNLPVDGGSPQLVASTDGGATTLPLDGGNYWIGVNSTGFASFAIPGGLSDKAANLTIYQTRDDGTLAPILTGSP